MLRNFHYIDEKGKDEGINGTASLISSSCLLTISLFTVRNRARELVELLADVEKIRAERRKAKTNRTKYVGVGNDGMNFGSDSIGGRYGGDSFHSSYSGGYSNGGFLLDVYKSLRLTVRS